MSSVSPKRRPAEVAGGLTGLATAVAALTGASVEAVAIVGTAAGIVPAVVTYLVANGGLRGVCSSLWRGRA